MKKIKYLVSALLLLLNLCAYAVQNQQADYSTFTLIISSDPQLHWACKYCGIQDQLEAAKKSNSWQVNAMNKIEQATSNNGGVVGKWPMVAQLTRGAGSDIRKPLGIIINGDLTEYFHTWQKELFDTFYAEGFPYYVYPGLGNHDYQNNLNTCASTLWGWIRDGYMHCARQAARYLRDDIIRNQSVNTFNNFTVQQFDDDSLAYSFEIGNYHFVQLHNHPTYEAKDIPVKSSLEWLKSDLKQASSRGKRIVLNMHKNLHEQLSEPIKGNNVVAVFVGHQHQYFGYDRVIPQTQVPSFFSGSSEYNKFLLVEFGSDYINVGTIDAVDNKVSFYEENSSVRLKTYLHPPYTPAGSGSYWSEQARTVKQSDKRPALTAFNNALYMAWKKDGSGEVYTAAYDGYRWGEEVKIPGSAQSGTGEAPDLVVYQGNLYCAWIHDENIYLASSSDGKNWKMQNALIGISTKASPALAVFAGRLYAAWNGYHNDGVFFASFDGSSWSDQRPIGHSLDKRSDAAPALLVHTEKLYAAWKHDEKIHMASTSDGSSWYADAPMLNMGTRHAPALASYNEKLFAFWNGYHNDGVFYASFNGTGWTDQNKAEIPNLENDKEITLAEFDDRLYIGMEYYGFRLAHYNEW